MKVILRILSVGTAASNPWTMQKEKKGKKEDRFSESWERKVACVSSIGGLWSQRPPCLPVWWRYETGPTPCPVAAGAWAAR